MSAEPRTPCVASGRDRSDELAALFEERILVLDGATGTMLQRHELAAQDFGGEALEGCNEALNLHRPDVVLSIHRAYLTAGADIIETNTFGGTPLVLEEYGLADRAREINRVAAELARRAADESSTASRPRFVAGSMGPTTKAISVTGGVTFAELVDTFAEQARGLLEGGADVLVVETCQDTRNTKAALVAIERVLAEAGTRRPIIVSGTIEPMGTMLAGQTAEAFVASVEHAPLLAIGLNCATGPDLMTDHLRAVHEWARCAVSCYPNAGLPGPDGLYPETPESLAAALDRFAANGWLNLVGGCCGTTDRHIAAIAAMAASRRPRRIPSDRPRRCVYTGIDLVEATDETRPLLVGERTNVVGSAKFRRLVAEERWDEASDIARRQVRGGAQIIDVCLQATERDERADVAAFYERLGRTVKAPLMIDSTDAAAVELALTYCQGRSIVNSINLEDGEARFAAVAPLLKRYGAAVVVGCIDEHPDQAQAFTRVRKLEVALRSHELLTGRYGLADADLIFDALVFPAASGDEAYVGGAVETLEGLRMIKEALPGCRTILGVSNVSFGLPVAAREILNSVFLYHATLAGLDLAIVNTERLERFASISPEDRELAEDLLLNRPPREVGPEESGAKLLVDAPSDWRHQTPEQRTAVNRLHIARLTDRFRGARRSASDASVLTLDERLARYVVEGSRDGLVEDLKRKLDEGAAPLEIVNGPLMRGMDEVGRLFNTNQLIVAEVLQSAESMKAAVGFLEGFMESTEVVSRGRMVLATVKGDVHDIGKNLVDIILSNNGFEVVNLGIKVPPHDLIAAVREHGPDAIGLSGLLVKSAHQMVITVEELAAAGIRVPVLVGGAALSEVFTRQRIATAYPGPVVYCADAMKGLETMKRLAAGDVVATPALPPAQPSESNAAASPTRRGEIRFGATRPCPGSRSVWRPPCARDDSAPARDLVLHQPSDAVRQAPRVAGPVRTQAARARHHRTGAARCGRVGRGRCRALDVRVGGVALRRRRARRRRHRALRPRRRDSPAPVRVSPSAHRRRSLPCGFRAATARRGARQRRPLRHHRRGGRRRPRPCAQGERRAARQPRGPGAGARNGRGRRRVAPPEAARALGLSGHAGDVDGRPLRRPLPRPALLVRLPGLPQPRRPGGAVAVARPGRDRGPPHRGNDDGARGLGLRARCPPPGRELLLRRPTRLTGNSPISSAVNPPQSTVWKLSAGTKTR